MPAVSRPLCSVLALGAALAWSAAAPAQRSFQGTGQVVSGVATIDATSGTIVRVGSAQTVINWTPDTGAGVFQPAGTTALFATQADSGLTDFAVLNRIIPADPSRGIQLDGTILARLRSEGGAAAGTIYFYSPGGIVVGPYAVIDVGSLGLTTSDIVANGGQWLSADRTVTFATSLPGSAITLAPGSSITTAGGAGSYTAIVAPQILHQGSIRTSGAAALVAADSATITFSPDNLYSIEVRAAAPDRPGGLSISGGTIGRPASGEVAAAQRLYLVSIPKNSAMTMLIEGGADLGFTPAGAARIEGNAIVLSAGRDIDRGALGTSSNGMVGNAVVQDSLFRDATVAGIDGAANLLALGGELRFADDLTVRSQAITLRGENGGRIAIGGNLLADARGAGSSGNSSAFGGTIDLVAGKAGASSGGTIEVGGATTLYADGVAGAGGNGTGGTINLIANGNGDLRIGGALLASADGLGGGGAFGGTGNGGALRVAAQGGSISLRDAMLHADGVGGAGTTGAGGSARGGTVALEAKGHLQLGSATIHADASGGAAAGGRGGDAWVGGLTVAVGPGSVLSGTAIAASATARGGAAAAGNGQSWSSGGNRVQVSSGKVTLGRFTLAIAAAGAAPGAARDLISLDRGSAAIGGDFAFTTPGLLGVTSNAGLLTAGAITLGAGSFVAEPAPASLGRFSADRWTLASAGDLVIGGDLASGTGLAIDVPGRIQLAGIASGGPVTLAAGGPLAIAGAVTATTLTARSGGEARFGGPVTASERIVATAAGLLAIDGSWSAPVIELTSSDLALATAARLTATGDLRLTSTNGVQLLIGDGLTGSGYALSNAEFAQLKGGNITLTGRGDASAAQAIQIGRLALAGSQLGPAGTLRIATALAPGRTGVIGILGALSGTGLTNAHTVELEAARIELDASKGSINLAGSGALPAGALSLRADRLWAADPAILARLNANSSYTGRERDLAQPSATPHPEGLIRAGTVQLFDARQILVQNSGTRTVPTGVTTSNGAFLSFTSSGSPIELIANGQIVRPTGTTTGGFAVQTALTSTEGFRSLVFTPNSSINGCLLNALACGLSNVIRDEDINLGSFKSLPDKLFGEEEDDTGNGKKGKASAIAPAERLVDRKPLERVQPVDEPVSGTGNPALTAGGPVGGGR